MNWNDLIFGIAVTLPLLLILWFVLSISYGFKNGSFLMLFALLFASIIYCWIGFVVWYFTKKK